MKEACVPEIGDGIEIIANRYRIEERIGQGGMAVVYVVYDTATKRKVALKRLSADKYREDEHVTNLFGYEYHTLVQLSHPRVVTVYDFGKDDNGPYYTMELLDGGDLRELTPIPWKKACTLLWDVCSALGLLHSRRYIHRDLTPRNVRCTKDGRAKLIDFGAMMPMGPCKHIVGTPPFLAPEVVAMQSLDGRSDLFSLGATAYYSLTGQHAYPVKTVKDLPDRWRVPPQPITSFVTNIPRELDDLVMSLINLDAMARPATVAEVLERLSAIASIPKDERLTISQSYLCKPLLIGRDEPLQRVRKHIVRAFQSRSKTILVEGDRGVGRSRFLDACVLEGKIAGITVLRADASDAHEGPWGAIRAITSQLIETLPDIVLPTVKPYLPIIGHVLPDLYNKYHAAQRSTTVATDSPVDRPNRNPANRRYGPRLSKPVSEPNENNRQTENDGFETVPLQHFDNPEELRPRVHAALLQWINEISIYRRLMVAIDDVHQIDEPSLAFVALLANQIAHTTTVLVVTVASEIPPTASNAVDLIQTSGTGIKLRDLDLANTETLLSSLFGDVPNIQLLASRFFAVSLGNPDIVIKLAQHLVDKATITYQAGVWTLPSQLETSDLPNDEQEVLKERIRNLGVDSLRLLRSLALCADQKFSFDECRLLFGRDEASSTLRSIDELIRLDMLTRDDKRYFFRQRDWLSAVVREIDEETKQALHDKLAEMFECREGEDFRVTQHLILAGDAERALTHYFNKVEPLIVNLENSRPEGMVAYLQSLPEDWVGAFDLLIEACERSNRPRSQLYRLHNNRASFIMFVGNVEKSLLHEQIDQLYLESGLRYYDQLEDIDDHQTRLSRALEIAQKNYDSTDESIRVHAPLDAIRELARALTRAIKLAGSSLDHDLIKGVPSLEPFIPLSPALSIVQKNVDSTVFLMSGHSERAYQGCLEILDRLSQSDYGGLDKRTNKYVRLAVTYSVGLIECSLGLEKALQRTDALKTDRFFEVNCWRLRTLYHLAQGDADSAQQCKKQAELLRVKNSPSQYFEGTHFLTEVMIYSVADDLMGIYYLLPEIKNLANQYSGWKPVSHFVRGEYQRIRGSYKKALDEFKSGLQLMKPGRHSNWIPSASAFIYTLIALRRYDEAAEIGAQLLEDANRAELDLGCALLEKHLALAQARIGDFSNAVVNSESAIERYTKLGVTGIYLASAYEMRARVAIRMGDNKAFFKSANLCSKHYNVGKSQALTARFERLMLEARRENVGTLTGVNQVRYDSNAKKESQITDVSSIFLNCNGPQERAQMAIKLILQHCKCTEGFLYTVQKGGAKLSAQIGNHAPPLELDALVNDTISAEIKSSNDLTITCSEAGSVSKLQPNWETLGDTSYYPLLVGHSTEAGYGITAMAVLVADENKQFQMPVDLICLISKSLFENGDVTVFVAAD